MIRSIFTALALLATPVIAAPTVIWDEPFNTLDPGKWQSGAERFPGYPRVETRWPNGEYQQYVAGQVKTEMGRLVIDARPMTTVERDRWVDRVLDPKFGYAANVAELRGLLRPTWVSGQVSTYPARPFGPGTKLTARLHMTQGQNAWPAVWAYDYVNQTEVDVFEGSGRSGTDPAGNLSQGIHDFGSNVHRACPKKAVATTGMHDVSADWTDPKKLVFAIDGVTNCTVDAGPRMTQPMSIIVNMAVGSSGWDWIGVPNATTPSALRFRVDWIKVEKP